MTDEEMIRLLRSGWRGTTPLLFWWQGAAQQRTFAGRRSTGRDSRRRRVQDADAIPQHQLDDQQQGGTRTCTDRINRPGEQLRDRPMLGPQ